MADIDKEGDSADDGHIAYRSGVAARMAGLSPETLRVWERRYNLSGAERSASGQRLYAPAQIRKLCMLKQLVDQGHAIGVLALMSDAQLDEVLGASAKQPHADGPISVGVIGSTLGKRIAASMRDGIELVVKASCAHLDQAAAQAAGSKIDVLVVEQSELHESAVPQIVAAKAAWAAGAVLVLYRFCASATIRALRAQGCLVVRMPADLSEISLLCRSALAGEQLPPEPAAAAPDQRFDENALLSIQGAGTGLACECPKHLADLLLMVGSFERYSAQCASRSDDDALLHQSLQYAAAQARATLETAMERLLLAEGIVVPR